MEIMFSALIINVYKHHVCLLDITITWERGKRKRRVEERRQRERSGEKRKREEREKNKRRGSE